MQENRRSFLRRGAKVLALAVPAAVIVAAAPQSTQAAALRSRVKGLLSRRRGCPTC